MDMNWQAMLHEAANASFEKDIEVRAAADNDACSCVDLPKSKDPRIERKRFCTCRIRELFCYLVDTASGYLPKKTEEFFQNEKMQKGRFRFYCELTFFKAWGLARSKMISDASLKSRL